MPLFELEKVDKLNYVENQIDCYVVKLEYNRMTRDILCSDRFHVFMRPEKCMANPSSMK